MYNVVYYKVDCHLKMHNIQLTYMYMYNVSLSLCRTLGTPDEDLWRGVTSLPDYKSTFPKWPRQQLHSVIKGVSEEGIDLLEVKQSSCRTGTENTH